MKNKNKVLSITLLTLMFILIGFGILMIYSASMYTSTVRYDDSLYFVKKQLIGFAMGVAVLIFFYYFDYHKLVKYRLYIIIIGIVVLLLVFIPGIGISANGAKRWIGIAGFNIQSSEVAKFAFVIYSSCYLSKNYKNMKSFKGILPIIAFGGLTCLLVILEPNMSVTMCIGIVMLIMLIVGGISSKYFLLLAIPCILLVPILIIIEPYRFQRLVAFVNPWLNPKEEGYQLIQSLYSLGAGGILGVGLFNSTQKYMFLPFAESDFIFSIIGEEFGLLGSVLVVLFFLAIITIGIKISLNAIDRLGSFLSIGIISVIAIQVLINIAVVTGSIPPTGIPLPFISAGGTSLMVFMGAIGILLNISKNSSIYYYEKIVKVNILKSKIICNN